MTDNSSSYRQTIAMGDTLTSQTTAGTSQATAGTSQATAGTPRIAVTRGAPTRAELAAVLALLFASAHAPATAPTGTVRPSAWARGSRLRPSLPSSGPRAWRTSAQPC